MSQLSVYAYFDSSGERKYVDNTDFVLTGTWSAFGSYVAERDAVAYSDTQYMAIITNVGGNPQMPATRTTPRKWSPLVLLYEYQGSESGTSAPGSDETARAVAQAAYDLASHGTQIAWAAWDLAQVGTNLGWSAWNLAQIGTSLGEAAWDLAQTGTNLGWSAWSLAQIGTNTGSAAYDLAQGAVSLAWTGTDAWVLAQYGTNTGTLALNTAQSAYLLAQSGTNTGSLALDIAQDAWVLAQYGTNTGTLALNTAQDALLLAQAGTSAGASALGVAQDAWVLAQYGTNTGTAAYELAQQAYLLAVSGSGTYIPDENAVVKDFHIDWGHGATQVDAADVPYLNVAYPTVAAALDFLLYTPIDITSFTNGVGTVEVGTTVNNIDLDWTLSKTPVTQSLNQGIGSLATATRDYTASGTYTSSITFTLTVSDGTSSDNASTTASFQHRRYWGSSANTSLTDPQILGLTKEFSSSRVQSRTLSPSAQYVYFAYPTSFGAATFTVNGLLNSAWTLVQRNVVNASGHSEPFNIYRSDNLLTGTYQIAIS